MKFTALAPVALMVGSAFAKTFTVIVGQNSTLTYSPSSITGAAVNDVVAFQFVSKNHTVTQSTFAAPCNQSAGGINSGFFPVAANATVVPQWNVTIKNASAPLWFFCAQIGHCPIGMVFAINPTANKSFDAFQAAAKQSNSSSVNGPSSSGAAGAGSLGSATVNPASPSSTATGAAAASSTGAAARLSTGNAMRAVGLMAVSGLLTVVL